MKRLTTSALVACLVCSPVQAAERAELNCGFATAPDHFSVAGFSKESSVRGGTYVAFVCDAHSHCADIYRARHFSPDDALAWSASGELLVSTSRQFSILPIAKAIRGVKVRRISSANLSRMKLRATAHIRFDPVQCKTVSPLIQFERQ
jgi:hypothetical protein